MSLRSVRFFSFLAFLATNLVVALASPDQLGDLGLWTTSSFSVLVAGRSWQHVSNGKHQIKS